MGGLMKKKITRKKGESKVGFVQREFKAGNLHSGSKTGPKVTNPKQAIAIGLNQARKEGEKVTPPKKASHKPSNADKAKADSSRRKRNRGRS